MDRADAITQVAAPCWVLRLPDGGEVDGGIWEDPHYATQHAAQRAAMKRAADGDDGDQVLVPVRLGYRCWVGTAACGRRYLTEDIGVAHFEDRAVLLTTLLDAGWRHLVGGGMGCAHPDCDECPRMARDTTVPVEMPGQLAIGVEISGA